VKVLTRALAALLIIALLVAVFSCGGRRLTLPQASLSSDSHASHRASSYDPFAPVQPTVRPDEAAIAALPGVEDSGFKLVAVNEHYESAPELLARLQMEVDGEAVRVILTRTIHRDAYLYLFYPTAEMHLRSADKGAALGEDYLFLAVAKHRGVVALGLARARGDGSEAMIPSGEIVRLRFASGAAKDAARAAISGINKVEDVAATISEDGTALVSWQEMHPGDYNNDGLVSILDLTPLAANFGASVDGAENPGKIDLIDGNRDGFIAISDITPLAANFDTTIAGYNVYRTLLATQEEDPDPLDSERWERVLRMEGGEPVADQPTVVREGNGQDFRLPYSLNDRPEEPGFYAYFVRPYGLPGDDPSEGPISNVAKTEQPTGQPELFLTVVDRDPPLYAVGDHVILQVSIQSAYNLFSANVRFFYRSDIMQLVDAAPSMDGYDPNLLYDEAGELDPLFLGLSVGPSGVENYDVAAFNATRRAPAPTVSGSGTLAYFDFAVIDAGGAGPMNQFPQAFVFPTASNFIYLMGEEYGIFLPSPRYTDMEGITVTTGG